MFVQSILPNQVIHVWSWYHSFQKTMFYLLKSKYAIFFNFKVTKIKHSAFFGSPGIHLPSTYCCLILPEHSSCPCASSSWWPLVWPSSSWPWPFPELWPFSWPSSWQSWGRSPWRSWQGWSPLGRCRGVPSTSRCWTSPSESLPGFSRYFRIYLKL